MQELKGENHRPQERYFNGNLKVRFQESSSRSPQSLKYEVEVEVIKKHLGDLEKIRESLGLSRRKMAQLLMVDPSAWTRWIKNDKAPPHVYRALQWYMELVEKCPGQYPQNSSDAAGVRLKIQEEKLNKVQKDLERQIAYLKKENSYLNESLADKLGQLKANYSLVDLEKKLSIGMGWKFLVLINFVIALIILLIQ